MHEHNRHLRDHEFVPADAVSWPALYATEKTPLAEKVVVARYEFGAMTWLVLEYDPEQHRAFCWADLGVNGAEVGYTMLDEIEMLKAGTWVVATRDTEWVPKRFDEAAPPEAWLYTLSERDQEKWRRANA